jgi:hypothetical protein
MQFADDLINAFAKSPMDWDDLFGNPLSIKEELMLNSMMEDIHRQVNAALNAAMDDSPFMFIPADRKVWMMDLLAIQKKIRVLIDTRGALCLDPCSEN